MFWPLPVVSMGQEANEPRLTQPLGLSAANELVEDDLMEQGPKGGTRTKGGNNRAEGKGCRRGKGERNERLLDVESLPMGD